MSYVSETDKQQARDTLYSIFESPIYSVTHTDELDQIMIVLGTSFCVIKNGKLFSIYMRLDKDIINIIEKVCTEPHTGFALQDSLYKTKMDVEKTCSLIEKCFLSMRVAEQEKIRKRINLEEEVHANYRR